MQPDGLFATAYQAPAQRALVGPAPTSGRGQFAYIAAGSVQFGEQTLEAGTTIFIAPSEPRLSLTTGPLGAEILLMQFPHNSIQSVQ